MIGQVSDAADPEKAGRVKLTFPWLSDDYVSDWARTVQPGAGKDRGLAGVARGRRRGAGGVRAGGLRPPNVVGGLHNELDTMPQGPVDLVDGGTGRSTAARWSPAWATGST